MKDKLGLTPEQSIDYIEKCKKQISKEKEIEAAIGRRGEWHKDELKLTLENIENYKKMLKILENEHEK